MKLRSLLFFCLTFLSLFLQGSELLDLENDISDFVLETRRIEFDMYPGAFNPSVTRWKDKVLFSFRIRDPLTQTTNKIGLVWMDNNFEPLSDPYILQVRTVSPIIPSKEQDPRLIVVDGHLYIIYSNLVEGYPVYDYVLEEQPPFKELRRMYVAEVFFDGNQFFTDEPDCLKNFLGETDLRWEKNWVPFEYENSLLLAYSLSPHRVLKPYKHSDYCEEYSLSNKEIKWDWGVLRGGTQALLEGDRYLAFFHSSLIIPTVHSKGKKITHYFMGAYTFDAKPPFEIKEMSQKPIVGPNCYNGPEYKTWKPLRCIFPCGFISDKNYVWVVYGRQDFELWVIKLDKKKLFDSLITID